MDEKVIYGLITGNDIISHSPLIHKLIADIDYQTFKLSKDEVRELFLNKGFKGINVTIPYKTEILSYLDELNGVAKTINVVNTVVNNNGKLIGFNTDYFGFAYSLEYYNIDVRNKRVVILGSGATSITVKQVLIDKEAKQIIRVSRKEVGDDIIGYDDLLSLKDIDIVINTTPLKDRSLIDFDLIKPKLVIDVNYNPLYSKFLIEAKKHKIRAINGLMMLVAQAFCADEIFLNRKIDVNIINEVYRQLKCRLSSIALIGLSYSGKSTLTKEFAKAYGFYDYDIDETIEKRAEMSINDIFRLYGEEWFRQFEKDEIKLIINTSKSIIALGGGAVLYDENMDIILSNCLVIYVRRDLKKITLTNDRPLIKNIDDLLLVEKIREPLYKKYCDVILDNNDTIDDAIKRIKEVYDEYLSY